MSAVPVRCPSCGAKATVEDTLDRFTCEYCGTESILQLREGLLRRPAPLKDAPADTPVATAELDASFWVVAVLFSLVILSPVIGSVWYAWRLNHGVLKRPIVVDVDRDGKGEVLLMARRGQGDQRFLTAYDEVTGHREWSSPVLGDKDQVIKGVYGAVEGTVLFAHPEGSVVGLDGKTGARIWSFDGLYDAVDAICPGDKGKARLTLKDDSVRRVDLASGAIEDGGIPCERDHSTGSRLDPELETYEDDHYLKVEGLSTELLVRRGTGPWVVVGEKSKGTRVPHVAVLPEGFDPTSVGQGHPPVQAAWSKTMAATKPMGSDFRRGVTMSDDAVYVAYEDEEGLAHLAGFRLKDGGRLFDVPARREVPVAALAYANGRVYFAVWTSLTVHDAKTGARLWRLGV